LVKGFGRYGVGEPVSKGPRKGLPSRDQITSLKQSIRDISGRHTRANLPEQGMAEGLPQTLRKVVPGYAKREIDKKMDAEKFGKTDVDRDANYYRYKKIQDKLKEQGVAEGVTSPEIKQAYDAVMQTTPRSPERRAAIAKYQKLRADALKNKQQGMAEGGQRLGRPNDTDWDETSGKVGRVEKTSTGLRHHADPSRYGGTEHEPELNRLNKGAVNAMDRALGVKWDRESNRYYSPLKVDMEEGGQEPGADYRDPPETDYDATGHDASVARLKHLAGVGPMKTVYDPARRVYRNMPTAVQPKRS
jgi:hypothetical protein